MYNIIQITLAILFFLCLLDMPYGYFQLVRFLALVGFGVLAYQAAQQRKQNDMIIFCVLVLLFQPFFKISLGRGIWNIIDVIVGVGLLVSVFNRKNNE